MDKQKINAEVLGALKASGDAVISRIPKSILDYLEKNCNKDEIPQYDQTKTIDDVDISKEARTFLTMLKLQYLCETEEEKEKLMKQIISNNWEIRRRKNETTD